ncbi:uncharacterized protein LOC123530312 [Mercenaria mercenaria]|uniref:uncharacterized protein LOC123530312 n=1 Tax=Mercenaria mercenaria TaxID=6596 RepID=UPI00234F3548|nr:uncharacterized protein LOC123530312 [Mercenaria mercenaria]
MSAVAILKLVATLSSGFYFHGCLYMSVIEHPARKGLPITTFILQWRRSCHLAKMIFVPTEILCLISTFWLYFMDPVEQASLWLICPTCIVATMTWSVTKIRPDVQRTTSDDVIQKNEPRWITTTVDTVMQRHNVRTAIGLVLHLTVLTLSFQGR